MNLPGQRIVLILLFLTGVSLFWLSGIHHIITFEHLQENRMILQSYVTQHYIFSVLIFLTVYIGTAFFIPGTLALTVASGFLFGFVRGTFYAILGGCFGAIMAFLLSRYLIGSWIQSRFNDQLDALNTEIESHGYNYLLFFRIVPILPFFMVNYLAGLTEISTKTFILTTVGGMLPGALVCSYAGEQIGLIASPHDIFTTEVITAFILLAILILLPPVVRHTRSFFTNEPHRK